MRYNLKVKRAENAFKILQHITVLFVHFMIIREQRNKFSIVISVVFVE